MRGRARITEEMKQEMVDLHRYDGWTLAQIGEDFGCSRQYVHKVLKEKGQPNLTKSRWISREDREFLIRWRRLAKAVACAARFSQMHGQRVLYVRGCRCDECKNAQRLYQRSLQGKTPPSHGRSGYVNYGCRCDICSDANREYQRLHPEPQRRWYENNKEKTKERVNRWRERNPEKVKEYSRRQNEKRKKAKIS